MKKINYKPGIILIIGIIFGAIVCVSDNASLPESAASMKIQNWTYLITQAIIPVGAIVFFILSQIKQSRAMMAISIGISIVEIILIIALGITYIDGAGLVLNADSKQVASAVSGYKIAQFLSPLAGKIVTFRVLIDGAFNVRVLAQILQPVLYIVSLFSIIFVGGVKLFKK